MSLKVTFEVDGQTEQQIAPVVAQWVARHPEWIGDGAQEPAPAQPQARDFRHDNAALLQQHIQQLTAQNKLLQQQVSYSQRLLAGAAKPKAMLPPAADSKQVVRDSAVVTVSNGRDEQRAAPPLPAQYRTSRSTVVFQRLRRSLGRMPSRLWRSLIWLCFGNEWLLIFLLLSGGTYGTLSIAPVLSNKLWPQPEFVESDDGPGNAAEPIGTSSEAKENAPATSPPASPTSKAGSHPAPPPAFQQP